MTLSLLQKDRVIASPLAKRMAVDKGIDLKLIKGTGPNGRIVRADIEGSVASGAMLPVAAAVIQGISPYDAIPNTNMRKVIARRLTESKQTVPHFYLTVECQLDELLALRHKVNEVDDIKVSVNDFIIRAVALALKKVPAANVSWTNEAILQYRHADISIAVSTPAGLITPIIRAAETKSMASLSLETKDLIKRARDGKLKPEEYQGGGFSISNLGMYGVKDFAAIINPPQACILAIGAGEQRPVVVKDGQLGVATVMSCTLSVDHRAVDGAVGAHFLSAFKKLIEKPFALVV